MKKSNDSQNNLTKQVFFGSGWMFGARLLKNSSGLIVMLILANLLIPEDFGLIATGTIAISLIRIFTEVGFKESIIKETDEITTSILNTAWTVEFIRGLLIFGIVYLSAPIIAGFFNEPDSIPVIQVLAFSPLIHGFTSIKIVFLQKELDFKKQFLYETIGILSQFLVTVPLAFYLQNVWALVIGAIAGEFLKVVISYLLMPYMPKTELNFENFKKMFAFGKWYFLGVIVSYFGMELDTYIVAKYFDSQMLGIYVLAFTISNKPVVEISKSVSKVLFPAYAKLSKQPEKVRNAFIKSTNILYAVVTPLCIGLSLVSEDFVKVFLDENWYEMIGVLQILALASLMRCIAVPSGSIFYGLDKPKVNFIISFIRMISLVLSLVLILSINENLNAAAFAVLFANAIVASVFILYSVKETYLKLCDYVLLSIPILISSAVMILTVSGIQNLTLNTILSLILSILLGGSSYILTQLVLYIVFNIGIGKELIYSLKKIKNDK